MKSNASYYNFVMALNILPWEFLRNPKMWNISRTKKTKIWDSGYYEVYTCRLGNFHFRNFGLGSFGSLCKISDVIMFQLSYCGVPLSLVAYNQLSGSELD